MLRIAPGIKAHTHKYIQTGGVDSKFGFGLYNNIAFEAVKRVAEMTGVENIFMNGTFIGMTNDEIKRKKQTIIDFSELGDFINEPIKTYSSGMTMRLAFSIAIHADPTCFLVDEALSVGDAYFQQKCMRKIHEFRTSGGSIIFVSHDMNAIKML